MNAAPPPLDPDRFHPDNHDASNPADPAHPEHPDHPTFRERFDEFVDRLEDAAIAAEYATGYRETSEEEARAGVIKRMARITLGTIVTIIGIIALPLPGPGWLIIAGGLAILSKDVAWADRALRYVRAKVPGIPEDGKIPRSSMVTIGVMSLAAVSASLWWTFARGSDEIQAGEYAISQFQTSGTATEGPVDALLELGESGPLTVTVEGCEAVEIAVTERSKTSFTLGSATGTCESGAELIEGLAGSTVDLSYETDGLLAWFLADDFLAELSNDDVTIEVAGA